MPSPTNLPFLTAEERGLIDGQIRRFWTEYRPDAPPEEKDVLIRSLLEPLDSRLRPVFHRELNLSALRRLGQQLPPHGLGGSAS